MALGGWKENSGQMNESPVDTYLEFAQGDFKVWDKEKSENIIHSLDKFIVLNIGYTIKGKLWNDGIRKFTNTYYSNEIASLKNQELYVIDMIFQDGKAVKTKAIQGVYSIIKEGLPKSARLHTAITVLDLNDNKVKSFALAGGHAFGEEGVVTKLQEFNPEAICSINVIKGYGKQGSDDMITLAELDEMKGSEASEYKARYKVIVTEGKKAETEALEAAEEMQKSVIDYIRAKHEWYKKEYGAGKVPQYAEEPKGVQSDEDFEKEVKAEQAAKKKVNNDEISIEDIPF